MGSSEKFKFNKSEFSIQPLKLKNLDGSTNFDLVCNVVKIPCDKLILDKENSEIYGNEDENIDYLVKEIKQDGFKSAIMAYLIDEENSIYQIESGHRRFLAAKKAGLKEIPTIITPAPKSDAERRKRLVSMNLHARENLTPTKKINVINALYNANKELLESQGIEPNKTMLLESVADDMELSVGSIKKYKQFEKLIPELQVIADKGISWTALLDATSLSDEKQLVVAHSLEDTLLENEIEDISREFIKSMIRRISSSNEIETNVKKHVKRRNGAKIIAKYVKDFDSIVNGTAIIKKEDKEDAINNLMKIKENIDKALEKLNS